MYNNHKPISDLSLQALNRILQHNNQQTIKQSNKSANQTEKKKTEKRKNIKQLQYLPIYKNFVVFLFFAHFNLVFFNIIICVSWFFLCFIKYKYMYDISTCHSIALNSRLNTLVGCFLFVENVWELVESLRNAQKWF